MLYSVEAVVFDAVGTLLYPEPSVPEVYADYGRRLGYHCTEPQISQRFRRAMRLACWQPATEEQHRQVWRSIVAAVFDDASDRTERLFELLWRHFAQSSSWRLYPDVMPTMNRLVQHGRQLVIASNFDRRLQEVCQGITELPSLSAIYCATELGVAKPAAAFFDQVAARLRLAPSSLLMVGDDFDVDVQPALRSGWHAVHLQRGSVPRGESIRSLAELLPAS